MIWVAIVVALAVVFGVALSSTDVVSATRADPDGAPRVDDPMTLLAEQGTPETAALLRAQGVDLGALGYEEPGRD